MKVFYLTAILLLNAILFSGCATTIAIGMSEKSFLATYPGSKLVGAHDDVTIYRKSYDLGTEFRFYYFRGGRLDRIDQGVSRPDIIIQNNR